MENKTSISRFNLWTVQQSIHTNCMTVVAVTQIRDTVLNKCHRIQQDSNNFSLATFILLSSLLGTCRSATAHFFSLSLVTVPEVFAKINSAQLSHQVANVIKMSLVGINLWSFSNTYSKEIIWQNVTLWNLTSLIEFNKMLFAVSITSIFCISRMMSRG